MKEEFVNFENRLMQNYMESFMITCRFLELLVKFLTITLHRSNAVFILCKFNLLKSSQLFWIYYMHIPMRPIVMFIHVILTCTTRKFSETHVHFYIFLWEKTPRDRRRGKCAEDCQHIEWNYRCNFTIIW